MHRQARLSSLSNCIVLSTVSKGQFQKAVEPYLVHSAHSTTENSTVLSVPHMTSGVDRASVHALRAVQESQDAAVNNPGSAYGASPLGPGAGSATGNAPATSDAEAGTRPEVMPSQPLHSNGNAQQMDGAAEGSEAGSEQQGLALPFEPVALVFKDIHYYVKQGGGDLELLRVGACSMCVVCASVPVSLSLPVSVPVPVSLSARMPVCVAE